MNKPRYNLIGYILLVFSISLFIIGQFTHQKLIKEYCNACAGISSFSTEQKSKFMPIVELFHNPWGYVFLGLFTLSGYLIKPRKVWLPLSIGIYIGLALLFTYI